MSVQPMRVAIALGLLACTAGCGAESGPRQVTEGMQSPVPVESPAPVEEPTSISRPPVLPRRANRPASVDLMSAPASDAPTLPPAREEPAPKDETPTAPPLPTPAPAPAPVVAPPPTVSGVVTLAFVPSPVAEPTVEQMAQPVAPPSPTPEPVGGSFLSRINPAVIGAPSVTTFGLGSGASKRTVSQTAIPIVLLLPIGERLSMDLSTAIATSDVSVGGASVSTISGLTDTQLRGNYTIGQSMLVTAGLNLPTGQYLIPATQQEAAGQIGNDFLNYGVSSMGTGFALTGGVAYARPIGTWNLGLASSLRKATRFDAFEVDSAPLRFTPSDEVRLRVGVDRPVGDGQIDLGVSYSAFGVDVADTTTYSTGDRILATAGWSFPVKGVRAYLSAWNLFRLEGEQLGGPAPGENVFNLGGGASFTVREILLQPSAELRLWQIDGVRAGNLVNLGVRARLGLGAFAVYPSVGLSTGTLFSTTDGTELNLSGFRGSLTVRWR